VPEGPDWRGRKPEEKENIMSKPAHKIRIGVLQATIWRNHSEKGNWYSVNLTRSYKVNEGWRETDALGQDDLLPAAKLLDMADSWITHQKQADAKARKESVQAAA
jgi:hypothetical protein